jgi:peptidoglycan/xylan/chitin deacetylase (PgdA/CDA1 family)
MSDEMFEGNPDEAPQDRVRTLAGRPPGLVWSRRGFLVSAGALVLAGVGDLSVGAAGPIGQNGAGTPGATPIPHASSATAPPAAAVLPTRAEIVAEFAGRKPKTFGLFLPGAVRHGKRRMALTFDACGGPRGSRYDKAVITTLRKAKVPATLFLNSRWIEAHRSLAAELAADPLFEIGNHGWLHRPLTVGGQSAYGIAGSRSAGEAYDEIVRGLDAVAELTGSRPLWFRPGTAYADDVGMAIARRLGVRVAAFSVNADYGATASKAVVVRNLRKARSKDIVLSHFNQPGGKTAEGLAKALPKMIRSGRHFATLSRALS